MKHLKNFNESNESDIFYPKGYIRHFDRNK